MPAPSIVQDIYTAVHQAITTNLYQETEQALIARSDALLYTLPTMSDESPTTAQLLQAYHTTLHAEMCQGSRPRNSFLSIEEELRDITRAVMVSMGGDEGLSLEAAVLMALVLFKRGGLERFCALPPVLETSNG